MYKKVQCNNLLIHFLRVRNTGREVKELVTEKKCWNDIVEKTSMGAGKSFGLL